jgi:hypothetical protein
MSNSLSTATLYTYKALAARHGSKARKSYPCAYVIKHYARKTYWGEWMYRPKFS